MDAELKYILELVRGGNPDLIGIDENKLAQKAVYHRATHLIYNKLCSLTPSDKVSASAVRKLKNMHHSETLRTLALTDEFKRIGAELIKAGISFIPFKGILLAREAYPPGVPRQFADNDLLVKEYDVGRVESILYKAGYTLQKNWQNLLELEDSVEFGFARSYVNREAHYLQFDVHTKLAMGPGRRRIPDMFIWKSALKDELEGIPILKLPAETELLYLCWHTLKHASCRVGWLRDLWFFIGKNPELKEDGFFPKLVTLLRTRKVAAMALRLAGEVFHSQEVLNWAKSFSRSAFYNRNPLFNLDFYLELRDDLPGSKRLQRDLALLDSPGDIINYLLTAAFPHPVLVPGRSEMNRSRLAPSYIKNRLAACFRIFK
ncbi:nucleotidyltransferase family protein [bacterium]|nr:nucleotidyltransferase family protein [bacterium]